MFSLSSDPLVSEDLSASLENFEAGALVAFEGRVRNHNEGRPVSSLEYQVYEELALKEGSRILVEAREKFNLKGIRAVHRHGHLRLGETAIWIGATASHRDDAFKAARYVIDEIKHRLPVWKKEHYLEGDSDWVFCRHHKHHIHFSEAQYYQKQERLVAQDRLKKAKVIVFGAGGLGSPALLSLAQAGVGEISIVDFDRIEIGNIHRQSLYAPNLVGERKVDVARQRLKELNPFISVTALNLYISESNAEDLVRGFDLVLDCLDNMQSKYVLHDACFRARVPLVSASVYKNEGQVRSFLPGGSHGCLRCQVKRTPDDSLLGNCNDFGVLGATTNLLGSIQASEAIQLLQKGSCSTLERSLYLNVETLETLRVSNRRNSNCPCCDGRLTLPTSDLEVGVEWLETMQHSLIDIRDLEDQEVLALSGDKETIILYCHRGIRSKRLARELRSLGHKRTYSLRGGACSL